MKLLLHYVVLVLLAGALAGCDNEGRTRPPQTSVRVLNAVAGYDGLHFLREENVETSQGQLPLGGGRSFRFDSDDYEFSVEAILPGASAPDRLRTIARSVNDSNEYFIVFTQDAAATVDLMFVAQPLSDSTPRVALVHAAADQGQLDLYIEPAGTDPAGSVPQASLVFGSHLIAETLTAGSYEVIVTPSGDPSTVLLRTDTFPLADDTSALLVLAAETNLGTVPFGAYLMSGDISVRLSDPSQPSAIRVVNGASDMLSRDIYLDSDFAVPLVADTAFGSVSGYVPIAAGARELDVTPAGNPGVVENNSTAAIASGRRYTAIIAGNPTDDVATTVIFEDHRSLAGVARLQIINAAHAAEALDYYITTPGTDVTTIVPTVALAQDGGNFLGNFPPGSYELTIRNRETSTNVYGPSPLPLPEGSVQLLLATDAAGGSTVDAQIFDDTGN